jgi:hypothetical protein
MTALARPSLLFDASRRRWFQRAFIAGAAIASLTSSTVSATTFPTRESHSKAAAFCNVISFTDWPTTAFRSTDAPFVIGVLGEGAIGALLAQFLENETWRGRPIVLRHLASTAEAQSCHVLFVAQSEHLLWQCDSLTFARLPILTVSDADDFARSGGMVQLTTIRDIQRVIVNLGVARSAGLTISSKLLRLAEVIEYRDP